MFLRSTTPIIFAGVVGPALMLALILTTTFSADAARRKGRACKSGHIHYGSSAGQRSKKVARKKAVASWEEFTAYEYGKAWARFRRASGRIERCSEGPSGWDCKVEAEPCRLR